MADVRQLVCSLMTFMIRFSLWKMKLGYGYKVGCLPLALLRAKQNLGTYTQDNIASPEVSNLISRLIFSPPRAVMDLLLASTADRPGA